MTASMNGEDTVLQDPLFDARKDTVLQDFLFDARRDTPGVAGGIPGV